MKILIKTITITITVLLGIILFSPVLAVDSMFYLSWQSDSSAPLDYQGKKLAVVGSNITIFLQPLIYGSSGYTNTTGWHVKWFVDDEFEYEDDDLFSFYLTPQDYQSRKSYVVRAEVQFPNGLTKSEEIIIPISAPKVIIRLTDGTAEVNEKTMDVNSEEVGLKAEAYFFSTQHLPLFTTWFVDDSYVFVDKPKGVFKFQRPSYKNISNIKVVVESSQDSLVRGIGELILNFY